MKKVSLFFVLVLSFQFVFSQEKINETQKMSSLCKIWGFLKYYHPNVAKGKFLWDEELIIKASEIEKVNSKTDLNVLYNNWLVQIGEVPKIVIESKEKEYFDKNFNLNWIKNQSIYEDDLIQRLVFIEQNRNQGTQYYISRKGIKTELTNELNYSDSFPTKDIRIVEFFRFWNLVEYFYPHKYKMDKSWDLILEETLPKIINCKDQTNYHLIYVDLLVQLKDSHAFFYSQQLNFYFGTKVLPVISKYAEGKLIITDYRDQKLANENNLFIGDVISKVNNKDIDELFEARKKFLIAANDAKKMKIFTERDYCFSSLKDTIPITIEREDKSLNIIVRRYFKKEFIDAKEAAIGQKIKWTLLENNIGYVNMKNSDVQDIDEIYENLKNAKAIIFDIRNYPNYIGKEIVEKFGKSKKVCAKNIYPDLDYPGRFYWKDVAYGIDKEVSPFNGKIIILVDENSQSRSEWTAMQLQTLENSFVIGRQTAGSDGEILKNKINNIETTFTINGVFYPNKEETQGNGIKIDIEVKPTLQGLKANKDEILDRAVNFITIGN